MFQDAGNTDNLSSSTRSTSDSADNSSQSRPERSLPRHGRPRSSSHQPESILEPGLDLFRRQHSEPRGRQLDGERNAVEAAADANDRHQPPAQLAEGSCR